MAAVRQGCSNVFSKATGGEIPAIKLRPGVALPHVTLPTTEGGRVELGAPTGRWQLVVVYRGQHDPLDLTYLAALQHLYPEFEELGVDISAVSADTRGKACSFVDDLRGAVLAVSPDTKAGRIGFKVAYGLNEEQMLRWGLYVSKPLGPDESSSLFSEPALFLINPAGLLHVVTYSNASFARPDLKQIVQGIQFVQDRKLPIRGTFQ
ncbi:hypothetical protein ACKKBG_A14775 [Auxenochlorella protothecoides x Auxenochlorella symbiontica]|uniref:Thioredoxin domain-containing protein n=1 Tax=Auxenochlorella protothecoides TaxID=3075 RepID=A0A087SHV8_AUXPR|nr:hypothetical protein F751_3992 [Auxenochlorella protothecoides]KFM25312.1 hypothetical protein F751_3992 [Auxenochlorella protothecoides]RMZ57549.1 hypothetical protein APUTEX25_001749 [Auxenochlorella protothecoides]|eukprot:RMZ57549.1 hypothetical protein APUTEX25_001749 [Auxenochlorella protothecoides]